MKHQSNIATQWLAILFKVILYPSLFLAFYIMQAASTPALNNLSRTAVTTTVMFILFMVIFSSVFGGYKIGTRKKHLIFSNLMLATLLTDAVTYVILQIMNVNPRNPEANDELILSGSGLGLLLGSACIQLLIIYLIVSVGYALYYKLNQPQNCLIVSSTQEQAEQVAARIHAFHQRYILKEVARYDCPDILQTIKKYEVVFLIGVPATEKTKLLAYCYKKYKSAYLVAEFDDVILSNAEQSVLDDTLFLRSNPPEVSIFQRIMKRGLDIAMSLCGLILLSPLLLLISILIRMESRGSILVKQKVMTYGGKSFWNFRFRTRREKDSTHQEDKSEENAEDDTTKVGSIIRARHLDKLPQLWNVLTGSMSIVGPGLEMVQHPQYYHQVMPGFRYRQQMKAGITGLAQIEGRQNTSGRDRAILNMRYIESFSLVNDIKLMLRTLIAVFHVEASDNCGSAPVECPPMRWGSMDAQ